MEGGVESSRGQEVVLYRLYYSTLARAQSRGLT